MDSSTGSKTIQMITGDWRLIQQALEEKLTVNMSIDLEAVDEDEAASICEDIDRIEGILNHLAIALDDTHNPNEAIA